MQEVINEVRRDIVNPLNNVIATVAMDGYNCATAETVVDTGRMRSAWKLTKNQASRSKPKDPPKPKGHIKGDDIFGSEYAMSKSSARRVATTFDVGIHKSLWLTNNIIYAEDIDNRYGISKQVSIVMRNKLNRLVDKI